VETGRDTQALSYKALPASAISAFLFGSSRLRGLPVGDLEVTVMTAGAVDWRGSAITSFRGLRVFVVVLRL